MDEFTPLPMQIVETIEQIKAFTDPLRVRVLRMLSSRAATNQQVADGLGEPQAKVLYHVRFLLDAGLIRLVDTQIKGGNVEKYYRAVARIFDLRPPPDTDEQTNLALSDSLIENMRFEFLSSVVRFPNLESYIHTWSGWIGAERMAEFNRRLLELFREFWPEERPSDEPSAFKARLGVLIYRDPREPPTTETGN
jgi:DNA-binding transcriptional ArsR family regulator